MGIGFDRRAAGKGDWQGNNYYNLNLSFQLDIYCLNSDRPSNITGKEEDHWHLCYQQRKDDDQPPPPPSVNHVIFITCAQHRVNDFNRIGLFQWVSFFFPLNWNGIVHALVAILREIISLLPPHVHSYRNLGMSLVHLLSVADFCGNVFGQSTTFCRLLVELVWLFVAAVAAPAEIMSIILIIIALLLVDMI